MTDEEVWRPLRCNGCGRSVFVPEDAAAWIDPDLYSCDGCKRAALLWSEEPDKQLALELHAPLYERPAYDPSMAAIPF